MNTSCVEDSARIERAVAGLQSAALPLRHESMMLVKGRQIRTAPARITTSCATADTSP